MDSLNNSRITENEDTKHDKAVSPALHKGNNLIKSMQNNLKQPLIENVTIRQ